MNNNATDAADQIIPATTQVFIHSFWVGFFGPERGPDLTDIYDIQHLVVAWRLTQAGPVPILFPVIAPADAHLPIEKKPLFVGILMPDGHLKNIDGNDVRANMEHAKETALHVARRWWEEHDR